MITVLVYQISGVMNCETFSLLKVVCLKSLLVALSIVNCQWLAWDGKNSDHHPLTFQAILCKKNLSKASLLPQRSPFSCGGCYIEFEFQLFIH